MKIMILSVNNNVNRAGRHININNQSGVADILQV